jgi:Zn-dependent protease
VLVIGGLLVWALADVTLPAEAPGEATVAYWLAAAVVVCLFWMGLLAHELAHSVVAVRRGVPVEGITLWLLGGVSWLHGDAKGPDDELRIALAGPAVSIAIALASGAIAGGVAWLDGPDLVVASLAWLAFINGMLAVFNLVPAAPLDGGRVLHALVWRSTHSRSRATIAATGAGRAFGFALVGIGVLVVVAGDLSGMWFVFLGWFLMNAARAEATHVLVHEALAGLSVRDVMTADPITAPASTTVNALLDDYFMRQRCSAFPIVDDAGQVVGLVTLHQVKNVSPDRRDSLRASDVAWPAGAVPSCSPDQPVVEMLDTIAAARAGDGRALVFDAGALVGIVSPTDLNRALELARLHEHPDTSTRGEAPSSP